MKLKLLLTVCAISAAAILWARFSPLGATTGTPPELPVSAPRAEAPARFEPPPRVQPEPGLEPHLEAEEEAPEPPPKLSRRAAAFQARRSPPPPSAGDGETPISARPVRAIGSGADLERHALRAAIGTVRPRVRDCYERAAPGGGGRLKVDFEIEARGGQGRVSRAELAESDVSSAALEACLRDEVAGAQFELGEGDGTFTLSYPFAFPTSRGASAR